MADEEKTRWVLAVVPHEDLLVLGSADHLKEVFPLPAEGSGRDPVRGAIEDGRLAPIELQPHMDPISDRFVAWIREGGDDEVPEGARVEAETEHSLQVGEGGLQLSAAEPIPGSDPDWLPRSEHFDLEGAAVPPGDYTVRVRALVYDPPRMEHLEQAVQEEIGLEVYEKGNAAEGRQVTLGCLFYALGFAGIPLAVLSLGGTARVGAVLASVAVFGAGHAFAYNQAEETRRLYDARDDQEARLPNFLVTLTRRSLSPGPTPAPGGSGR